MCQIQHERLLVNDLDDVATKLREPISGLRWPMSQAVAFIPDRTY